MSKKLTFNFVIKIFLQSYKSIKIIDKKSIAFTIYDEYNHNTI